MNREGVERSKVSIDSQRIVTSSRTNASLDELCLEFCLSRTNVNGVLVVYDSSCHAPADNVEIWTGGVQQGGAGRARGAGGDGPRQGQPLNIKN